MRIDWIDLAAVACASALSEKERKGTQLFSKWGAARFQTFRSIPAQVAAPPQWHRGTEPPQRMPKECDARSFGDNSGY